MVQNQVTDLTMLATTTFDSIISQIQASCLNFSMQLTPFSAVISLRKSFVTDKSGFVVTPAVKKNEANVKDIVKKIDSQLETKHEENFNDMNMALESIKTLKIKL